MCSTTGADETVLMPLAWQGWCFANESPALGTFSVVFAGNFPEGAAALACRDRGEVDPRLAGRILVNFG